MHWARNAVHNQKMTKLKEYQSVTQHRFADSISSQIFLPFVLKLKNRMVKWQ